MNKIELKFNTEKNYFKEIEKATKDIKNILTHNRKNRFITDMRTSIKSNEDVLTNFPIFFKKVLMPICYDRFFGKKDKKQYSHNTPAIGKWFGYKGWKNITHLHDNQLINDLTQEHIDLIPDKEKKLIAQDFFDFSRVFSEDNHSNVIEIPMNIKTTLYEFNWVQVRDMAKTYVNTSSYYNTTGDEDFTNYIYPAVYNHNGIITNGTIQYNTRENTIKITFTNAAKVKLEEIFINKSTINERDEKDKEYLFLSERLCNWKDLSNEVNNIFHEMFLDDIETLLIPEIKNAVKVFIAKQKIIADDWNKLQMKYVHKVLQKGNI